VPDWGSFVENVPLIYRDPSGHTPEWLDRATGAFAQYADDVSLGLYSALVGDLDEIDNAAYQEGREIGRAVSTVQGTYEVAHGAATVLIGLAAGPPTIAAGAACTAATVGVCAVPTGIALTAEGAMVIGGTAEAVHGGLMLAKIADDPLEEEMKSYRRRSGGGRPRSNVTQNKQYKSAVREVERRLGIKLSPEQLDEFHEAVQQIEGNPGYHEMVDEGLTLFDFGVDQ
jgi:hypothetical protein